MDKNIGLTGEYHTDCNLLISKIDKLKKGIESVRSLINESEGVIGLHLNGDIATWNELENGGYMEEWLINFNEAEKI